MKKNKLYFAIMIGGIAILSLSTFLSGCKKGEEDPGISFKSRAGRLAGDWVLKEGTINETDMDSSNYGTVDNTVYNGTSWTKSTVSTSASGTTSSTSAGTIERTYNFKKDGNYTYTDVITTIASGISSTETITVYGKWYFSSKSKDGEYKKGELLNLRRMEYTKYSATTCSYFPMNDLFFEQIELVKLSSKEMIMHCLTTSQTSTIGSKGKESKEYTLTFEKDDSKK